MPKLKTRRSIRRRFRFSSTGKIRRAHSFRRHLLVHRSSKRKRKLRRPGTIEKVDRKRITSLLPYR